MPFSANIEEKTAPRKIINNQEAQWGPKGGEGSQASVPTNYVEEKKEGFALDTATAAAAVVGRERRRAAQEGY